MPDRENRLTDLEREVVFKLVEAWNAYLLLPTEHPDDNAEFRLAIHTAQVQILARPGRREINGAT